MTPQSGLMIVAPIRPDRQAELRRLLRAMNRVPGHADPQNPYVPFGVFDTLHFARFVILEDQTSGDIAVHGVPAKTYPLSLAFLGDVDGDAETFVAALAQRTGNGLRRIFACCEDFQDGTDLRRWMHERRHPAAAFYVNYRGRTVRQVHEDEALGSWVAARLRAAPSAVLRPPGEVHREMRQAMLAAVARGELTLTPPAPTPKRWRLQNAIHALGMPLLLLALLPFILVLLPVLALQLRRRERSDPEVVPRVEPAHAARLAEIEDHDVNNQFSALGSVKPGRFRRCALVVLLAAIDYTARHIYVRGWLARVHTIHAARWVFLDQRRRVFFASNYDGSLESYMDDFINKVAFGLNLVFSNGVGYPSTRWLVIDGAKDEQKFKTYIRRHEIATEVWYNGRPGITAHQMERNARLREGLQAPSLSGRRLAEWCRVL